MINNTKKAQKPRYRVWAKRFCVTIHGIKEDYVNAIKTYFDTKNVVRAVMARESGKASIHPHLQIYFEVDERIDGVAIFNDLLGRKIAHVETAKGDLDDNLRYVYAVTPKKDYEIGWILYSKGVTPPDEWVYKNSQAQKYINPTFKPWQRYLADIVAGKEPADGRTIHYFWEPKGGTGKTFMCKYLHLHHGAIVTGGSATDMKHAIVRWNEIIGQYPIIVLVDVSRSDRLRGTSYKSLESIKNAVFFSGKYESTMINSWTIPHVVVFSNKKPDTKELSLDRWNIILIEDDGSYHHQKVDF